MSTPATSPQVEIVTRIYEAFGRGESDAALPYVSADFVVIEDDALPWGGRYEGREGVAEFVRRLVGAIQPAVTPAAIFQSGDHVVQFGRNRGTVRHNGAMFDIPECHVWTFRGDTIVRAHFFADSQTVLAALAGD